MNNCVGLDFEGSLFELKEYVDLLITAYGGRSTIKIVPDDVSESGYLFVGSNIKECADHD